MFYFSVLCVIKDSLQFTILTPIWRVIVAHVLRNAQLRPVDSSSRLVGIWTSIWRPMKESKKLTSMFYTFPLVDDFENFVAKWEIAHHEQFFHLPQSFWLCLIINKLPFMDIFQNFVKMCFKVVCCRFVVCGKQLILSWDYYHS